jgi:hypothetical protein
MLDTCIYIHTVRSPEHTVPATSLSIVCTYPSAFIGSVRRKSPYRPLAVDMNLSCTFPNALVFGHGLPIIFGWWIHKIQVQAWLQSCAGKPRLKYQERLSSSFITLGACRTCKFFTLPVVSSSLVFLSSFSFPLALSYPCVHAGSERRASLWFPAPDAPWTALEMGLSFLSVSLTEFLDGVTDEVAELCVSPYALGARGRLLTTSQLTVSEQWVSIGHCR